jgi:hypothetical protein
VEFPICFEPWDSNSSYLLSCSQREMEDFGEGVLSIIADAWEGWEDNGWGVLPIVGNA